ncbi:hypothetical protein [Propionimicrobium sp. PCR01-08-3]|uniref:hypothetical protein n=1 Tax=Propionimicrobium sp. PCR01-08-3 TaxID=3052086 RepID=UPI00255C6187|nr:hypothetical protein [Propionimicrobium sp. PCR01-08-3]WIY84313.1 hypothetical protein QQ658_15240 [Propionimicrobium sp. PCR01-08-3]
MSRLGGVVGHVYLEVGTARLDLGNIDIPIEAACEAHNGDLVIHMAPNLREVRECIETIFRQSVKDEEAGL